jgi:hypothetical protein
MNEQKRKAVSPYERETVNILHMLCVVLRTCGCMRTHQNNNGDIVKGQSAGALRMVCDQQNAACMVDGRNSISGKCSEQLTENSLMLPLYTVT